MTCEECGKTRQSELYAHKTYLGPDSYKWVCGKCYEKLYGKKFYCEKVKRLEGGEDAEV